MGIQKSDYLSMLTRLEQNARRMPAAEADTPTEVGRGGLHEKIVDWCNSQWPRWKCIHARTDKKSTIGEGVHDFTIFAPGGRTLCIECKMPGKKPTEAQQVWATELSMLGHMVYVVTTFQEFLDLTNL